MTTLCTDLLPTEEKLASAVMRRIPTTTFCSRGYTADCGRESFPSVDALNLKRRSDMTWTTPVIVEICMGLEINSYLPAGF
jgi:coenzyme PQQ precursor peptide PqqA